MAKAEIAVTIADLPIVNAKLAELDRVGAALRDEQPFPHTEIGDAIHNLRGRAETGERALAELRAQKTSHPRLDDHEHEWADWFKPIFYRDSLGALVGDVGLARLGGTDEPVTDGWVRVCRTCDTEERS